MSTRRHARRQLAGRRHHRLAVAGYAGSVWLAAAIWALVTEHVLPGGRMAFGAGSGWSIGPVIALAPALLGGFGYAIGLTWSGGARPVPARLLVRMAAFGGLAFTFVLGLLVPLFASLQAGLWPALVWCVAGSAGLAVWQVTRAGRRAGAIRRRRVLAA